MLKLFFMSVLWRASVSSQRFFNRVNLGPHEEDVRRALLASNAGDNEFYSVTLACFIDLPDQTVMLDPFFERYDGINYYRFFLGSYIAYMKVDCRPTPASLATFVLKPKSPLVILARKFHESKEKVVMRKLVGEHS